jgi:hypothetical protein
LTIFGGDGASSTVELDPSAVGDMFKTCKRILPQEISRIAVVSKNVIGG